MNSDLIFSLIASSVLLIMIGIFVVALTSIFIRKKRQHAKEKIELQQAFEQTLLQSQLEIQEQTLQHISRELHDNIGQMAGLLKLNLETIKLLKKHDRENRLIETIGLSKQLIHDIRQISINLNSEHVSTDGILNTLNREINQINKLGIVKVEIMSSAGHFKLNENRSIILYRMCQEILNNALKHSQASSISIDLSTEGNILEVQLYDNGIGFEPTRLEKKGLGLRNLYSRAHMLNGNLIIESSPGNGTKASITLPMDQ
jgi:signal transduction histidine kinase